jgi:hypothetical protein
MAIVDEPLARQWRESGLRYEDCFAPRDAILKKILDSESPNGRLLDRLREDLSEQLDTLRPLFGRVDPTLEASVATAERKILHNIDRLRAKSTRMEEGENEARVAMADRYIGQCYPGRRLQERVLGIPYFISRFGADLIDRLHPLVETGRFEHCLIEMDPGSPG